MKYCIINTTPIYESIIVLCSVILLLCNVVSRLYIIVVEEVDVEYEEESIEIFEAEEETLVEWNTINKPKM